MTLTRLARELSEAFLTDHYDRKRFRESPVLFRGKDLGAQDDLLFATMSHERLTRDAKESDQATVEYTVEGDPERPGETALFRREKARFDEDPDRGGQKALVCAHVSTFDVQYWDWKRQEWAREWLSDGVDHPNVLPTRVRVRLGLAMPGGQQQRFETQARVALIHPLAF